MRAGVDRLAASIDREQQAGFLQRLAQRRGPVVQAAGADAQARARRRIVDPQVVRPRFVVALVDQPAREHPAQAVLVAAIGAQQHQHLDLAAHALAQQHERRGRARNGGLVGAHRRRS
jgi:hypothetical protein